ncbi:MAG: lipid-transfer protein [Halieaceae bacterium]|jgi:acetyl-CoA acetyltransferase|nr:lipid-transfer protein [Halieaceae bacterium]
MTLRNKACVVGIGSTEFTRNAGRSEIHLAVDAITAACDDAGLEINQIDGMSSYGTAGIYAAEMAPDIDVARSMGIPNLKYMGQTPWGGGASCGTVAHAAMAVSSGVANYVVCYRSLKPASGTVRYGRPTAIPAEYRYSYYMPFGFASPTSWVAMFAKRWMHETGATREQLGQVALVQRENALRNPRAMFYGRPLTIEEYMFSPVASDPFTLHDTCLENDGSVALIVTTPERAMELKQKPAFVSGVGWGTSYDAHSMTSYYRKNIGLPECIEAGKDVFKMAQMTPKDIDVAQLYDAFTATVPMQLEAYGFCEYGEGGAFCEGGDRIRLGGELPVNTSGGQLSEAYIHGMNLIAEGVRQIRGTSTSQVDNAKNVLVTGGLGVPTSALILTKGD